MSHDAGGVQRGTDILMLNGMPAGTEGGRNGDDSFVIFTPGKDGVGYCERPIALKSTFRCNGGANCDGQRLFRKRRYLIWMDMLKLAP